MYYRTLNINGTLPGTDRSRPSYYSWPCGEKPEIVDAKVAWAQRNLDNVSVEATFTDKYTEQRPSVGCRGPQPK